VASAASPLPSTRLEFGLENAPDELNWMTGSGIPWGYRGQYLAGGVNTGNGWPTWQDRSLPPGQFALDYMRASNARGYIPVLDYYQLLQSTPSAGGDERSRDYSNLTNAATMRAYYGDFTLLLDRARQFGGQVVVHVEPDLWGYLEMIAKDGRTDAGGVAASVASSGFAELAGLPDTVAGFADGLLRLRDRHAPNAVMAIHASMWGTYTDIASATRAVDTVGLAAEEAAFLNSAGVASNPYGSTWDVVFHDIDDHAAGWWEATGQTNASFTHWWDPTNRSLPNFTRWLQFIGELRTRTQRPQVVWQVPMGNQYFLTMDNTCGHYQDNVGPWMIAHPDALLSAGIIGVIFGAGNACQPTYTDARHDGVTNGPGRPTTDLAGWCDACNTHVSVVSDDDGGYLRVFVADYYAKHPLVPIRGGYWLVASDGGIFPFGSDAGGYGSTGNLRLNQPIVGMAATPSGRGYWLVASDGGIFPFGDAGGYGSTGNLRLNQPIVGMAATPSGRGYWLVASDGGIFPFGDAGGYGSTGNLRLNQPIVGMAVTPSGRGYWLVASDGGIFPFGDAGGYGSTGNLRLNQPILGMAATHSGHGYWLVAGDGGIFPFGDAAGYGSAGGLALNRPVVGMAATPSGLGYWLVAADGGIFPFGDAPGLGSTGGIALNRPIVGMAAAPIP
jgi:hypothetical protein